VIVANVVVVGTGLVVVVVVVVVLVASLLDVVEFADSESSSPHAASTSETMRNDNAKRRTAVTLMRREPLPTDLLSIATRCTTACARDARRERLPRR
jgi:hypothetical protein